MANPLINPRRLRLLSYNIQAGVGTRGYHQYVTHGWKHLLPHRRQHDNLRQIGSYLREFDLVGLQEVDGGSFRSRFINQTEYLAQVADFSCWYSQTNRRLGRFAQHSLGVLSRLPIGEVHEIRLPGAIPGRGAMMLRLGGEAAPLVVMIAHLALGRRARRRQIDFICRLLSSYRYAVLMGDLNCDVHSAEFGALLQGSGLCQPLMAEKTFPSWRPMRQIDHVLVSPELRVLDTEVLGVHASDHLPIAVELELPENISIETPFARREEPLTGPSRGRAQHP